MAETTTATVQAAGSAGAAAAAAAGGLVAVGERLRGAEVRLERLLAVGWQNAGAELSGLAAAAAALDDAGAREVAGRLRAVAGAGGAGDALRAITLALAACRLLRARLPAVPLSGAGEPLGAPRARRLTPARLLPIGRLALAGGEAGEAWACVRLHGATPRELVLVHPLEAGPPGGAGAGPGWLRDVLVGHLRWRARYPLGAEGDVPYCGLEPAGGAAEESSGGTGTPQEPGLGRFLSGDPIGGRPPGAPGAKSVLAAYGPLHVQRLDRARAGDYVWPDGAARDLFAGPGAVWTLAWVQGPTIAPLALLSPRGLFRPPALVHLVPGLPSTPLGR